MADIFVSYCKEDEKKVGAIINKLEEQGWSVWWYEGHKSPGVDIDENITKEIDSSECVIVIWSANSIKSRYVKGEAELGINQKNISLP